MESISIQLVDQSHLKLNFFRSMRGNSMAPVFVILPALGIRAGYYNGLATSLKIDGNNVVTFERVGLEKTSSNYGYREVLDFDLPTVMTHVREKFKGSKIFFLGHSIGAQFGLLYSALYPDEISGMIAVAGGSSYYKKLKGIKRTKRKLDYHFVKNISKVLGHFPGEMVGLTKESGHLMRDWAKEGLRGSFSHIYKGIDEKIEQLNIPILFITLNNDRHVPLEGSEYLASKLKNAELTRLHLRDEYGLEEFHHFRWVKAPEPVVEKIQDWIIRAS